MLVLTRRLGETVVIEGGIRITLVAVQGNKVRLGISAPPSVHVDREEIHQLREQETEQKGGDASSSVPCSAP
jgi:carbon storage regulator